MQLIHRLHINLNGVDTLKNDGRYIVRVRG